MHTSDLGIEKIGESSTGVMEVGLRRIEVLGVGVVTFSSSSGSSPVLILSNSDLFTYFLPCKMTPNKVHH